MADQKASKADAVQKAQKIKPKQAPVQSPDIFIGGPDQKLKDLKSKFYEVRSKLA
jgi:hypothetical protein